jgi:hypothetical protein
MSERLERAKADWTRPADSIQASGRAKRRINRPDTRKHLIAALSLSKTSCIRGGVHTRTSQLDARGDEPIRRGRARPTARSPADAASHAGAAIVHRVRPGDATIPG